MLLREDIGDKNVVVISVAGAFRKEKDIENWLGPDNVPLEGFCWKGGSERITAGILMWSTIYIAKMNNDNEVAIILLDTQGTFDSDSTVNDCATIFALSTMVSSVQVYNISNNIQEDDLQHLQLFAEYGRLALADCGRIPFQKLMFLIRDWSFPYELDYGLEGGKKLIQKRLEIKPNQHTELQYLRRHIKQCFTEINCYLMPHPGLLVATNPNFKGYLRDIDPKFINSIENLAPLLLAPENLTLKKISGQTIKLKELYLYFKIYIGIFSGDELPEPKSMLVATAEANHLAAVASAKELYINVMEEFCGGAKPYMKSTLLESEHKKQKLRALECFVNKRKMGSEELTQQYRSQLNNDLEQMFAHYKLNNESKNIFKAARTPAVFIFVAVISYILSGALLIIGLNTVAALCNIMTGISLITLTTWSYTRYTGESREISHLIDFAADRLWETTFKPLLIALTNNQFEETLSVASANLDKLSNQIAEASPT
ncbi:hypothetical protein O3M35_006294 [Rhynocoris fuscipes]|uniref:GB1/RHD3-type G domain-containing protein n=1 Tax=Rhynocoris fuscipes TaxID=488301 RepID=A0AAW1DI49_9HEMI